MIRTCSAFPSQNRSIRTLRQLLTITASLVRKSRLVMAKPVYRRAELWQMGLLILSLVSHSEGSTIIKVENGGGWGGWHGFQMCPKDFYANGFSMRVDRHVGGRRDDRSLNGIRLFCKHITYPIDDIVVESPGYWGIWTSKQLCASGYLDSFQLRVEGPQGRGDDTAVQQHERPLQQWRYSPW
ncbi:hypothetical protein AALO_G00203980 [Alosa alosa]|uniref:Uncharacterized protein n=1 Tax=Alosa alosa TaxID=278164 RepID=A0AAV6G3T8_9TELE|nr:vitelline membrane outer layer protein 1-like [Alosa alosa]KAG5269610.1 hypothetical protein AALO_G00203980 [Alosa alosa]